MNRREHVAATLACSLAEEVVRTFGEFRLRVFGTSMVPSILPGDLISIQRARISEISGGDVVLYVRDGRMFVHRVVDCAGGPEDSLLITRGDRLRHNDPPVSSSELLGRVISIERTGKRVPIPGGSGHPLLPLFRTRMGRQTFTYVWFPCGECLWVGPLGPTYRMDLDKGF